MAKRERPASVSTWLRSMVRLVIDTIRRFEANRSALMAAGLAYYLLISTSPLIVVSVAVAGAIRGQAEAKRVLLERVASGLGHGAAETVQSLIRNPELFSGGLAASLIAVAVLLYGSTRAFTGLQRALDVIWETPPTASVRLDLIQLVRSRLLAVVMVLATGVLLLVGMALETLGSTLSGLFAGYMPDEPGVDAFGYRIILFALRASCLAATYRWLPWHGPSWRQVWPAGLVAAALLGLGHALLGRFIAYAVQPSAYGAAGSVIALLLSFYFLSYVVLLGAQFGKALSDREKALASQ